MPPQQWNAQLVEWIATNFPKRTEPNFALSNALSTLLLTPRLRGLWCANTDENLNNYDLSPQGRILAASANPPNPTSVGITPIVDFVAANTEYYTRPTEPGLEFTTLLTMWSWVYPHAPSTGALTAFHGKYGAAGDRGYLLYKIATDAFNFRISDDGTNVFEVTETAPLAYTEDQWYFVAGRYTASTELKLWVGNPRTGVLNTYTNIVAVPPTIFASANPFEVSRYLGASGYFDGYQSLWGLAGFAVTNVGIFNMFHQTRPLFMG